MTKVTPFLMFNDQLEAAMEFYTATFPDSDVRNVARTGEDGPITAAEFVVGGQVFMGSNGGPYFAFSEGFSLPPLMLGARQPRNGDPLGRVALTEQ